MAKKKPSSRSKTTKKSAVARTAATKKRTATKVRKSTATKKKSGKKTVARKKTGANRSKPTKKKAIKKATRLGRPLLSADAKLDRVFQKDYQAREIFMFLDVHTLGELEEFDPDEIVELLTGPMVQTVERIRKALAMGNRCLAGDRKFALEFSAKWKPKR